MLLLKLFSNIFKLKKFKNYLATHYQTKTKLWFHILDKKQINK
jgi:hypothetical protein